VRLGDADRAGELVSARLPLEPDPVLRAILGATAGLLAVEAGDEALAAEWADRIEAAPAVPAVLAAAGLLRVALGGPLEEYVRQVPAGYDRRGPRRLQESAAALTAALSADADLTAREIEVLSCLAAGMSNKQVARSLGISIRTVTVHVSNLLRKTRSASRTEAALWAVRHRLVD